MEIKKCQLNINHPCLDRGIVCLKTTEEKKEFNKQITKLQMKLERIKFKDPEEFNRKE